MNYQLSFLEPITHPVQITDRIEGPLPAGSPLVVSCGVGTDSVGVLVGFKRRGIRPDAILFSNPGNEFQHTYAYIPILQAWLKSVGFPDLTILNYKPQRFKYNEYETLAGNCVANRTLPSIAFGKKGCSLKWKGEILDKAVTRLYGETSCYRVIGYDCDARDIQRFSNSQGKVSKLRPQDVYIYPLQVWGLTRSDCVRDIEEEGLPQPNKSSCTFCTSIKPGEVDTLSLDELIQIVIIEANASINLRTVSGLWRSKKITDYIRKQRLLPVAVIEITWQRWATKERPISLDISAEDAVREWLEYVLQEDSLWLRSRQKPETESNGLEPAFIFMIPLVPAGSELKV